MSLSDYLKELIASDLAAHADARRRAVLYDEIARTAPDTVTRHDSAAALAAVRQATGTW